MPRTDSTETIPQAIHTSRSAINHYPAATTPLLPNNSRNTSIGSTNQESYSSLNIATDQEFDNRSTSYTRQGPDINPCHKVFLQCICGCTCAVISIAGMTAIILHLT